MVTNRPDAGDVLDATDMLDSRLRPAVHRTYSRNPIRERWLPAAGTPRPPRAAIAGGADQMWTADPSEALVAASPDGATPPARPTGRTQNMHPKTVRTKRHRPHAGRRPVDDG